MKNKNSTELVGYEPVTQAYDANMLRIELHGSDVSIGAKYELILKYS